MGAELAHYAIDVGTGGAHSHSHPAGHVMRAFSVDKPDERLPLALGQELGQTAPEESAAPESCPRGSRQDGRLRSPRTRCSAARRCGENPQHLLEVIVLQRQATKPGRHGPAEASGVSRRADGNEGGTGKGVNCLFDPPMFWRQAAKVSHADVGELAMQDPGHPAQVKRAADDTMVGAPEQSRQSVGEDPVRIADDNPHSGLGSFSAGPDAGSEPRSDWRSAR